MLRVCIDATTAQMEQMSALNQRAGALQCAEGILFQLMLARVAPAQKLAWAVSVIGLGSRWED